VLLDEPTTSLDAEAARQVVGAIRSATRDRTVLLVTHDPVLAAIADRTVHVSPRWRDAVPQQSASGVPPQDVSPDHADLGSPEPGGVGPTIPSIAAGADRERVGTGVLEPERR
jgi:energy-coupling factor transporter ATP-binding protein EcfA2